MATPIFAAIASVAELGSIASFGLSVAGAYLDSLIVQALVGGVDQEGQRVDEFRATKSEYGIPIPICYGPNNRVPGNIIWTSGITETKRVKKSGGNVFGGSSKITTYNYSGALAVAISARQISRVTRIWANNRIIFESQESDGSVPAPVLHPKFTQAVIALDDHFDIFASVAERDTFLSDVATDPPPTYESTSEGGTNYISSWVPDEIRDGIRNVSAEWASIVDQYEAGVALNNTYFPYTLPPGSETEIEGDTELQVTLNTNLANATIFLGNYPRVEISSSHVSVAENITVYPGTNTQTPDPTMEEVQGVGNVPAYRGIAYVVIKDIDFTTEFRNSVPNFEFEIEADTSLAVSALVDDLCERAGLTERSLLFDSSTINGFAIHKNSPLSSLLPMLEARYQFHSVQQNGDIRFIPRPSGMLGSLSTDLLGAHSMDSARPSNGPIIYSMVPKFESPNRVMVRYIDIDREYQSNTQYAFRPVGGGDNDYVVDIPLAMTSDEARLVAEQVGKDMWSRKWSVSFSMSQRYSALLAGQTVGVPFDDEMFPVLITNITRGRNGILEVTGEFEDVSVGTIVVEGETSSYTGTKIINGSTSILAMLDAPLIVTEDDDGGIYWAACGTGSSWGGCDILYSDGDSDYFEIADSNTEAAMGDVSTALPSGPTVTWDRTNTITVELYSEAVTLSSATETEVLNGANLIWLGASDGSRGEMIQFVNATFVSGTTYTLSTLLRGRYGTEHEVDNHGDNELMVVMDSSSVGSVSFGRSDWDETYTYAASSSFTVDVYDDVVPATNTGIRSKPLSPVHVHGSRDASNNLTVTWKRRVRGEVNGLGEGSEPINEETEAYEIDITGPGGVVLRTISATSETITYNGSDQFSDGLTPGDPVDLRVYQISATKGRGYPAMATV